MYILKNTPNLLNTPDDSDIGSFVETDLDFFDEFREKVKHFPFAPENGKINLDSFTPYMKKNKPDTYTITKKFF